mgnify:CR=1 FL=1
MSYHKYFHDLNQNIWIVRETCKTKTYYPNWFDNLIFASLVGCYNGWIMIGEANFVQLACRFTMKSLSRQHLTFDMFNSRIRWVIPNFLIGSYKEEIICQHCKTLRNVLKCHAISQITRYVLLLSYDWIITRLGFLS